MDILATAYVVVLLLGISFSVILGIYAQQFSGYPGHRMFLLHLILIGWMLFCYLLLGLSETPEQAFLWARLRLLGLTFNTPLFLLFVLQYTGRKIWMPRVMPFALFVLPVITQIITWSDQVIPLMFARWMTTNFGFLTVERSLFGTWFMFQSLTMYTLIVITHIVLIERILKSRRSERGPLVWLLVGNFVGTLLATLPTIVGNVLPLNFTPLGLSIGLMLYGWGLYRHRLFDTLSAAYHTVFVSLQDGVVVVNPSGDIIEWNDTAQNLLQQHFNLKLYHPIAQILPPNTLKDPHNQPCAQFEINVGNSVIDAQFSDLSMTNGKSAGRVLVLRDITAFKAAEEARKRSEKLYRLLADNSSDLVSLHLVNGILEYASPSCQRIIGYTAEELIKMTEADIRRLVHPDDLVHLFKPGYTTVTPSGTTKTELRIRHRNGTYFWAESAVSPIFDEETDTMLYLVTTRDISERKEMEEALREKNKQYNMLVDKIPAYVYQKRRTLQGHYFFDYVSPSAYRYTGYTPAQITADAQLLRKQVQPEDLESLRAAEEQSAISLSPFEWEGRTNVKGESRWIRLEAAPTVIEDGQIIWNGIRLDITERKRAEIELEQSRKLLQRITELLPDYVHVIDIKNRELRFSNREFGEMLGYSFVEIAAMYPHHLEQLMHPDDYAVEQRFGNRYTQMKDGEIIETEYRWLNKNREIVWLNIREMVYERAADGTVTQTFSSVRDVTARRNAQEEHERLLVKLQAANQDLREFAYVISHDLKAPLRGVNSISHWLSTEYGDKFDDEGKHLIALLSGRVQRMERMISGVLEYSRIGRDIEENNRVDLNSLVKELIEDIIPEQHITVNVENTLPTLNISTVRIRQVFQNLIDNAVKFMNKPVGEIRIGCRPLDDMWLFSIQDNGSGIAPEHHERIFQLFQTLAPKDQSDGTGVGLTITKRIIELYGGKIWLDSHLEQGTIFYFTLPQLH